MAEQRVYTEAELSDGLDRTIQYWASKGYTLQTRTTTTAQLVKRKKFSGFFAFLWFLCFGVGIVVYLLYYLSKRDRWVYVSIDRYGKWAVTEP